MNVHKKILIPILLGALIVPALSWSQEEKLDDILSGFDEPLGAGEIDVDLDDALAGFEDEAVPGKVDQASPGEEAASSDIFPAWLEFTGGITFGGSYNFAHDAPPAGQNDHRGLSRLRSSLDLTADLKLPKNWQARIGGKTFYDAVYSLRDREKYTPGVLEDYEDESEFTEVYLQGSLSPSLDMKIGRQIVVWGKSDNIRITDMLNPLDNREPGLVDIRDLRLPVGMTKLDYYPGNWNVSALVLHEVRFNKEPVFGNDFYPGTAPAALEEKPSMSWKNQEYALAINGIFSGWDLSFYGARLWDDQSHLENTTAGMRRLHSRITMLGSAINIARGNWLLKGEAAYVDGLEYSVDVGRKKRLGLLVGAEYTGISETVISLELANRHIFAFDDRLKQAPVYGEEDEVQSVLRLSRDFRNDTVQLTMLLSTFGLTGDGGSFQRFTVSYDVSDAMTLTGGIITYRNGDKALFRNIGDNDRAFTELRYSF